MSRKGKKKKKYNSSQIKTSAEKDTSKIKNKRQAVIKSNMVKIINVDAKEARCFSDTSSVQSHMGACFFVAVLLFEEIVLHLCCDIFKTEFRLFVSVIPIICYGLLLNLIASLSKNRSVNTIIHIIFIEIICLIYTVFYFSFNSYRVFMSPDAMINGAGGVIKGFSDRIIVMLTDGLPYITLFHIPLIVFLLINNKDITLHFNNTFSTVRHLVVTASFVVIWVLVNRGTLSIHNAFTTEYSFDHLTREYGLFSSLNQEMIYSVMGNPYESVFSNNSSGDAYAFLRENSTSVSSNVTMPVSSNNPGNEIEEPIVYGPNALDLDFAMLAENEPNGTVAGIHSYISNLVPSSQNAFTGLFEGKNLILITAEAFSEEVIDETLTPTLYRMANSGIVFEDYYQPAWGGSTSTGEYSILAGLVPTNGVSSMTSTIGHDLSPTIGNQLLSLGYFSRAYHDGAFDYYSRNLTHENFGYEQYIGMGTGMEQGVSSVWPESDLEMMQFTVDDYINNEPFSIYYMTVSGHCLYSNSGNMMSYKNKDAVADLEYSSTVSAYIAANLELEYAMEYLIERLEEAGIADDTVIVISADHYPYGLEASTAWQNDQNYLAELYGFVPSNGKERDHNALIIWSGCLEDNDPIVVSTPVYSLDILPTLSNLFGVEYDSRLLVGRDVFSEEIPLVIWPDYSWLTDKGYYINSSGTFIPTVEGEDVSSEYIDAVKAIVSDKITFSRNVLNYDYYSYVYSALLSPDENSDN